VPVTVWAELAGHVASVHELSHCWIAVLNVTLDPTGKFAKYVSHLQLLVAASNVELGGHGPERNDGSN
jgi:hypothetical protein